MNQCWHSFAEMQAELFELHQDDVPTVGKEIGKIYHHKPIFGKIKLSVIYVANFCRKGELKMPHIKYYELTDILRNDMGVDDFVLSCCDPTTTSFSFLQIQMQGDIKFSTDGVFLDNKQHDKKCKSLLEKAFDLNIDLVLFPEYCISYELLGEIVNNKNMWPRGMKLWCLPCQGISVSKFETFLEGLRSNESVLLIDTAWNDGVNRKRFVNAFFYAFSITDKNKKRLCLVPQIKTQHMADPFASCEMTGLTLGNVIFTINHRLITLLCADALNNEISWHDIQQEHLSSSLLLLHPQLNAAPKHPVFCRIRQEIQTHNHSAICISCNWAGNTKLFQVGNPKSNSQIKLSWSCIYHKHQDFSKERWRSRTNLLNENSKWGLFGSYMEKARMEVWYSDSGEHALMVTLPNTASTQYAVTQLQGAKAEERFYWINNQAKNEGDWQSQEFVYSLSELLRCPQNEKKLGQVTKFSEIIGEQYHYPFVQEDKYEVDSFFALTLPTLRDVDMTIDEMENLADWTLLLNDDEQSNAIATLQKLYELADYLQQKDIIPPRLSKLKETHNFCLVRQLDGDPCVNVMAADQGMLIAFARNDVEAHKISKKFIEQKCSNSSYIAEKRLGVIYMDIINKTPRFLPEFSQDLDRGEHSKIEGDITNGGY